MDPFDMEKELRERHDIHIKEHYYGDIVRGLFLLAGVILLWFAPSHPGLVPLGSFAIVIGVLIAGILAGLTNPQQRWAVIADCAIFALGLIIFEASAIQTYRVLGDATDLVFIIQEVLAIVFFFALYYSVKTLRGMVLK